MRFQLFCIVFLVLFLQTASALHGQNKLNLNVKHATLEEVLQQIRRQTGYDYVIRPEHAKKFVPLTLDLNDMEMSSLLQLCFQGQSLDYIIRNNTIIVTDQKQQRTISGIVTDTEKNPLVGASVRIKNTTNQTRTDSKGYFSLSNVPNRAVLEITYVGYEVRQIDLSNVADENLGPLFILKQKVSEIEEIAIQANTGYQKLDPSKATGSMVVIDEKKIQESPALSLMQRLEGQIAGVQLNMKENRIAIRTPNNFSLSGSYDQKDFSSPLIVIDGFPAIDQQLSKSPTGQGRLYATNSSPSILNNFNPDDIASITVLKDAAATSIWGSRAANGVIVIETKRGKSGRNAINFSSTFGITSPADPNRARTMSSAEYIDFEKELFDNGTFSDPSTAWRYQNISDALTTMFKAKRGEISTAERDAILAEMGTRNNRDQIRDELLQTAQTQQYNLSFNGVVNGARYYASAVYAKDRPIYRENNANNIALTFNLNNNYFNNKLAVDLGLNHTIKKSNVNDAALTAISPGNYGLRPYDMLLDENGQSINRYYAFTPQVIQERFESKGYLPWTYNHIDELNYNNDRYDENQTRITGTLGYKPLPWLNATLLGIYQRGQTNMESLRDEQSYIMRDIINRGTTIGTDGKLINGYPIGGKFTTSNIKSDEYSVRFQLDANKRIDDIHELEVFAGTEIRQTYSMGYLQTRLGFDKDTYQSVAVDPKGSYIDIEGRSQQFNIQDAPINISKQRFLSYYGNVGYTLLDRYYLTGSIRFDDATIIGLDRSKRAKPFWSAGLRWDIHKESFMKDLTWLNNLSLRSSIGTGGSVPTQGRSYVLYSSSINDTYTQLPNGSLSSPANQMLGWETTRTFNTGLDIALFKRLQATLDIYTKRSYGIIALVPYNATYGWTEIAFNTADMKSNGFEFQIGGDIIRNKAWRWNSSLNFAYTNNEVTDDRFPQTLKSPNGASSPIEGYPIDKLFAYRWAGLDDKGRSQIKDNEGNIIDADGSTADFTIDDLRYMGRSIAPYYGGWTNAVSYKNLTFTARLTMNFGHKVRWNEVNSIQYPTLSTEGGFSGFLSNSKALVDRWRQPGDEATTNIPGVINTNFNSIDRFMSADINVLDASHIRLQQLSLDYAFPAHLLNQNKTFKSLSLGISATNLGLLWKKTDMDIDPEYMFDGSYQSMPPTTSYMFRLNVGF